MFSISLQGFVTSGCIILFLFSKKMKHIWNIVKNIEKSHSFEYFFSIPLIQLLSLNSNICLQYLVLEFKSLVRLIRGIKLMHSWKYVYSFLSSKYSVVIYLDRFIFSHLVNLSKTLQILKIIVSISSFLQNLKFSRGDFYLSHFSTFMNSSPSNFGMS